TSLPISLSKEHTSTRCGENQKSAWISSVNGNTTTQPPPQSVSSNQSDAAARIISQEQLIRHLRGQTATFSTLSDGRFDEDTFEALLTEDRMPPLISRYWIIKIQARFMAGGYSAGVISARGG